MFYGFRFSFAAKHLTIIGRKESREHLNIYAKYLRLTLLISRRGFDAGTGFVLYQFHRFLQAQLIMFPSNYGKNALTDSVTYKSD